MDMEDMGDVLRDLFKQDIVPYNYSCPICLMDFVEMDHVEISECCHAFHRNECFPSLVTRSGKCPWDSFHLAFTQPALYVWKVNGGKEVEVGAQLQENLNFEMAVSTTQTKKLDMEDMGDALRDLFKLGKEVEVGAELQGNLNVEMAGSTTQTNCTKCKKRIKEYKHIFSPLSCGHIYCRTCWERLGPLCMYGDKTAESIHDRYVTLATASGSSGSEASASSSNNSSTLLDDDFVPPVDVAEDIDWLDEDSDADCADRNYNEGGQELGSIKRFFRTNLV